MSPTSLTVFLSLLIFYLFFISSFTYARLDPTPNTERFINSLNLFPDHDVSIVNDDSSINNASRLVEKRFKFPSLPNSKPSIEDLGHCADYYRLPHTIGARMFYFFFESRNNETDPVVLWLSGGPGASSNIALFCENGPFHITEDSSLVWNDYGWDKVSNIIYVDQPIGTGFSYSIDDTDIRHNLVDVTNDLYNFLQDFFDKHPKLVQNDFFITGQSFAGHYAPALASRINQENKANPKIHINLKGIAIGNGLTNPRLQYEILPYYARRCKLIEEEDYLHIKNTMLPKCMKATEDCDMGNETDCLIAFDSCDGMFGEILRRTNNINYYDYRKQRNGRMNYDFSHLENFLNNQLVKDALGVPDIPFVTLSSKVYEAMKGEYMKNYDTGIPALLADGIKVLLYVGEFDVICNYVGNLKWVIEMAWHGKEEFLKPQSLVSFSIDGIEMGALRSHGPLSFLEVHGAGHMVPMDQPKTALHMIQRWMHGDLR
ncbi:Serine carboxypeptidase-like 48 [Tripterygium wilfordii]|uniref:Serine carboxypeptidase-like 48 n=1 Tax=Tripterygium wilfordii TaxID=458696 RepID=A0A7J7D5N9_TRIWF|nr:serine carboxypeptidase-like 48 [Tripterygium wilfordii]KAF5741608.1 Serine carboxypeptidase-like 48 [Tripterygium wilfordii]